ncbi:unnamed protein product [Lymnaea stagnalis]|uniref:C1q domain-containing protein n=1 Tax=Lymnaea stagnalis TaxID=6523 RepID=A0AAV2HU36_LYMST
MASKTQLAQRLDTFLKHQLEMLEVESRTMKDAMDDVVNKMHLSVAQEMDQWTCSGHVNQLRFQEIAKNIQQAITFVIMKTIEISGLNNDEFEHEVSQTAVSLTPPAAKATDTAPGTIVDFESMTRRLATLEEDVFSMKCTTKEIQEKQEISVEKLNEISVPKENFDKVLNDVNILKKKVDRVQKEISALQDNVDKNFDTLHDTHLKFKKKIQERVNEIKEKNADISTNVDYSLETLTIVDSRFKKLEEKNEALNVSMNELNQQISSFRTCSNDALMSVQDLSKSVESTSQHYNEMSNKMNQLELSINHMKSQYTEQFENMSSLNKDKIDDLIGLVCHLVAKRLNPIETFREALNKIPITKSPISLKMDGIESQFVDLSNKIVEIESKCRLPNVGFYAWSTFDLDLGPHYLENFSNVWGNYGDHFGSTSGKFTAPLDGLYLMSISAKLHDDNKTQLERCKPDEDESEELCQFFGNQTITFCAEMTAGEQVFIKVDIEEYDKGKCVDFSCCLING